MIRSASTLPDELRVLYKTLFKDLGAASATVIVIEHRKQADDPGCVAMLDDMTGIFISGGDNPTPIGMKVHILTEGCHYDIDRRDLQPAPPVIDPQHAES